MFLDMNFVFHLFVPSWWATEHRGSQKAHRREQGLSFCGHCVWRGQGSHHTQDTMESPGFPQNGTVFGRGSPQASPTILLPAPPRPSPWVSKWLFITFLYKEEKSILKCTHVGVYPLGALHTQRIPAPVAKPSASQTLGKEGAGTSPASQHVAPDIG